MNGGCSLNLIYICRATERQRPRRIRPRFSHTRAHSLECQSATYKHTHTHIYTRARAYTQHKHEQGGRVFTHYLHTAHGPWRTVTMKCTSRCTRPRHSRTHTRPRQQRFIFAWVCMGVSDLYNKSAYMLPLRWRGRSVRTKTVQETQSLLFFF